MNAEVLQTISIIAFSLSGVFFVIAVILFFRLHIRSVIEDLSGKKAERQIRELRELNRQSGENGRVIYQPVTGNQRTASQKLERSGRISKVTEKLSKEEEETTLLQEEETTVLLREETTVLTDETTILEEEGTTVLQEEGTTVLQQAEKLLPGGYHLIVDEVIIHTKERI